MPYLLDKPTATGAPPAGGLAMGALILAAAGLAFVALMPGKPKAAKKSSEKPYGGWLSQNTRTRRACAIQEPEKVYKPIEICK